MQKEKGRGADGTFVHRKAFVHLAILSPSIFEHLLCVIFYVRCSRKENRGMAPAKA